MKRSRAHAFLPSASMDIIVRYYLFMTLLIIIILLYRIQIFFTVHLEHHVNYGCKFENNIIILLVIMLISRTSRTPVEIGN